MKQSGLGDNLYVAGYDLSGDIGSLSRIAGGVTPLEVTGIDKSAMERIGGKRDGGLEFTSWFNPAAGRAHERLSALPAANVIVTYCRGILLHSPAASLVARQVGYDPTRGEDGALSASVAQLADGTGLEWGDQLTPGRRVDAAATNGPGVDFAAASVWGLQAYLHVFGFTGTSATVKIQESSDDGSVDPYADVAGGAFAAVAAAPTSQRIATAAITVERWLRVVTTGVFTNLDFAVMVVRNQVQVSF